MPSVSAFAMIGSSVESVNKYTRDRNYFQELIETLIGIEDSYTPVHSL